MTEITREYLEKIGFKLEHAKNYDIGSAFAWNLTHEGPRYWCYQLLGGLTGEGKAKIDEMIRVWEGREAAPQPAIEYCITAGPGLLIDYGVTIEELRHLVNAVTKNEGRFVGYATLHAAPTTTACQTGV